MSEELPGMWDAADLSGGWADSYYRQSTTACCPRQTIPDSCSCLEGCDCECLDCDCGQDDEGGLVSDSRSSLDDEVDDWDGSEDDRCSHCGGDWFLQECDDPIQCCDPRCDGVYHPCVACQGTGLAKHQVIW